MKPPTKITLFLTAAVVVVAAVTVARRPVADGEGVPQAGAAKAGRPAPPVEHPAAGRRKTGQNPPAPVTAAASSRPGQVTASKEKAGPAHAEGPQVMDDLPPAQRCAMVERTAARELDRMTARLNLSPVQQSAIFPLLARSVAAWMPGMSVQSGDSPHTAAAPPAGYAEKPPGELQTPSAAVEEKPAAADTASRLTREQMLAEISKYLTPDQRTAFLRDQLRQRLWWNDAMARITRNAALTAPAEPETPPPPKTGSGRPDALDSLDMD